MQSTRTDRSGIRRLPGQARSGWPGAGAVLALAVLALAACAGPTAKKPPSPATSSAAKSGTSVRSPAPGSGAAKAGPVSETASRPLEIAVFDANDYRDGRKQREELLAKRIGDDALTPDDIGYYMEVQEAELRRRVSAGTNLRISGQDGRIVIGPIENAFASASAQVEDGLRAQLDAVVPVIKEFSKTLVVVHAYTDASGPAQYNRKLSIRRALAVARYLREAGIDGARLVAVGHGESGRDRPAATAKERAQGRRVSIELDPLVRPAGNRREPT